MEASNDRHLQVKRIPIRTNLSQYDTSLLSATTRRSVWTALSVHRRIHHPPTPRPTKGRTWNLRRDTYITSGVISRCGHFLAVLLHAIADEWTTTMIRKPQLTSTTHRSEHTTTCEITVKQRQGQAAAGFD